MSDEELVKLVDEWWATSHQYIKLDQVYGLDFCAEILHMLIKVRDATAKLP